MLNLRVKLKAGIIQVLLLLLALSVIAASSVSIMAQQKKFGRELSLVNSTTPRSSTTTTPSIVKGPCYPVGDVDNDGVIKPDDVQTILNYVAGIKPTVFTPGRADVNKDGKITAVDAQLIQQYLAGSIKTFAACGS